MMAIGAIALGSTARRIRPTGSM